LCVSKEAPILKAFLDAIFEAVTNQIMLQSLPEKIHRKM